MTAICLSCREIVEPKESVHTRNERNVFAEFGCPSCGEPTGDRLILLDDIQVYIREWRELRLRVAELEQRKAS